MSDELKPTWLKYAEGEMGVHEISGPASNLRILAYLKSVAINTSNDEIPWCSAFVNWSMMQAHINGTSSARARSWINWGVVLKKPILGCVVVFPRGNNPDQGHVGFYVGEEGQFLKILGGNQSDSVKIALFPRERALTFRMPDPKKVDTRRIYEAA